MKKLISERPPKINWGKGYLNKPDSEKIKYLENFASSMNHAAYLIQGERDQLGKLCELKEKQLIGMNKSLTANNTMLQQEITKINEQRQGFNAEVARLNSRIRELEKLQTSQ